MPKEKEKKGDQVSANKEKEAELRAREEALAKTEERLAKMEEIQLRRIALLEEADKPRKPREAHVNEKVKMKGFTLLNDVKVRLVLDVLEGITTLDATNKDHVKMQNAIDACKAAKLSHEDTVLALYDRCGGGVLMGEGDSARKIGLGTFWNFPARKPKVDVKIGEDQFEDEFVLQRKKTKKQKNTESTAERFKRLDKAHG